MSSTFPPDGPSGQEGRPDQGPPPQWQQGPWPPQAPPAGQGQPAGPGQPPAPGPWQGQPTAPGPWQPQGQAAGTPPQGWGQRPEYLEQGSGAPLVAPPAGGRGGRRRGALIAGGVVGLLAVGAGAWAVMSFMSQGPQPAEALPAATLGYASIDLDPSGSQKIEALKTLKKFPAVAHQLDQAGISDTRADIREKIFDAALNASGCGLKYADDIEPWIGDRAAVAAVDLGKDQPAVVGVLQVTDEKAADEGLTKLQDCAAGAGGSSSSGDEVGGWAFNGSWVVIAQSDSVAQDVVDEAGKGSLADDADYQKWTDEVGDPGIVNLYAAPKAGHYLASMLDQFAGSMDGSVTDPFAQPGTDPFAGQSSYTTSGTSTAGGDLLSGCSDSSASLSGLSDSLEQFKGMAATLRFNDGAVEFEVAGEPGTQEQQLMAPDKGGDVVATLPDDTAVAMGMGFQDGWFTQMAGQFAKACGSDVTASDLMSQWSSASGLDLPSDAETLTGESLAIAVGPGIDASSFESSDPSGVPVAVKIKGDPDAIDTVLDKVRSQDASAEQALGSSKEGDTIVVGPDSSYRDQVLRGGGLGSSEVYRHVIREQRAAALLFVNFDAGNDWLAHLADGDPQVKENLEPLEGLGIESWTTGDASHGLLRLTTQ